MPSIVSGSLDATSKQQGVRKRYTSAFRDALPKHAAVVGQREPTCGLVRPVDDSYVRLQWPAAVTLFVQALFVWFVPYSSGINALFSMLLHLALPSSYGLGRARAGGEDSSDSRG